jgi:hypothetical protein
MKSNTYMNIFITLLLIVANTGIASADQIYKWTDSDGLTHYSEAPPLALTESVTILGINISGHHGNIGQDDYYSIVNQARRMEESRLKKEQLRIDREAQRQAVLTANTEKEPVQVVIQQPSYPVALFHNRGNYKHSRKNRKRPHHMRSITNHTGLGNSPALQVKAHSGMSIKPSPSLQIGFEDSIHVRR